MLLNMKMQWPRFAVVLLCLTTQSHGDEPLQAVQDAAQSSTLRQAAVTIPPKPSTSEAARVEAQSSLLRTVAKWLSEEFAVQSTEELPRLVLAPASRMFALRYRGVRSDHPAASLGNSAHTSQPDIVAIYDDETKTIFLPENWTGATPAETSVLVHEMVHHIQNIDGTTFACAEAREEMAFAAQDRWLRVHGTDLEVEFGLDPFTILVRTNCPY